MFVTTKAVWSMVTGELLELEGYEYDGPVAEAKKGSKAQDQSAGAAKTGIQTAQNLTGQDINKQNAAGAPVMSFSKSLIPASGKTLSPYASEALAGEREQIGRDYGDATRVGLRQLASRGMGSAPPGLESSVINTANQQRGAAETAAVQDAYNRSLSGGLEGVRALQGEQQIYDPNRPLEAQFSGAGVLSGAGAQKTNAAQLQYQDIGKGLSGLAMPV